MLNYLILITRKLKKDEILYLGRLDKIKNIEYFVNIL